MLLLIHSSSIQSLFLLCLKQRYSNLIHLLHFFLLYVIWRHNIAFFFQFFLLHMLRNRIFPHLSPSFQPLFLLCSKRHYFNIMHLFHFFLLHALESQPRCNIFFLSLFSTAQLHIFQNRLNKLLLLMHIFTSFLSTYFPLSLFLTSIPPIFSFLSFMIHRTATIKSILLTALLSLLCILEWIQWSNIIDTHFAICTSLTSFSVFIIVV